jgi:endonuclease/exonuclease/phosphatase family metal-dependent hydrolase
MNNVDRKDNIDKFNKKNRLKIMSYNIWFDNFHRTERLFSLFDVIYKTDPDVICLQEVLDFQYDTIKNRLNYQYYYPEKLNLKYGCVILSKYPIKQSVTISLPSAMKRNLSLVKINIDEISFVIANVHFESEFNTYNNTKKEQFKHVGAILNKMYYDHSNVILCSDTNTTEFDELYLSQCFNKFKDAWIENGSDMNKKFTYDYDTNTNLQLRKIELKCRIDRILFKLNNTISCFNFDLLTNIGSSIEPSDHHGIMTTFIF